MSCPGSFIRVALPGSGDALICCIAQFAHSWYLLVTIYVSCRFRNQSAPLNWKQCSAYTTEQQLCWGCTVTLTHSVSKLQQRQLDVAASSIGFFTRVFTVLMARSTCPLLWGYLGLLVICSKSYLRRELSELAVREMWTIVRHH